LRNLMPYASESVPFNPRQTSRRISHPKPKWLKKPLPKGGGYESVRRMLSEGLLHTVCQEAKCPNLWECFSKKTATFLILGNECTRNCRFCSIRKGHPVLPDPREPDRVARAAETLGLQYVVVTSVTRDDLPDGGAGHFAKTITTLRNRVPGVCVEVLIPDFGGNIEALETVLRAYPDVLNHNIETVPRLYALARPEASYRRSLDLLSRAAKMRPDLPVKSGIMLGLGEMTEEIETTLRDLRAAGCRVLTLGQYLQPTRHHLPVARYVPPDEFEYWRKKGLEMGFAEVFSGPLVRSSYHAREIYQAIRRRGIPVTS